MTGSGVSTPFDDLTYRIIGCAMAVHRDLGPGLREDTYHRDLAVRFEQAEMSFESERLYEVHGGNDGRTLVGYYVPDFIVEEHVVVEIKALETTDNTHVAQVIGYLAVTGCQVGLLINFGARSLERRRIFPPRSVAEHRPNRRWLFVPNALKPIVAGEGGPRLPPSS